VQSVNDGILNKEASESESASDPYPVDYSTTTGTETRWDNAVGGEFDYQDMTPNDEKGLTYTTLPLTQDITLIGHPVVYLWLNSSYKDGNIFVYLEEVDESGFSHYLTEGVLKLSHRALNEPPYDNLGLPLQLPVLQEKIEITEEGGASIPENGSVRLYFLSNHSILLKRFRVKKTDPLDHSWLF
jgi:uncharacterized protein